MSERGERGSEQRKGGSNRRGDENRNRQGRQRSAARMRGDQQRSDQAPGERRRQSDPARQVSFDVLTEVSESDAYANLVLPPRLARRHIVGRDAGFATELTYGTLRLQGRYDAILATCVTQPIANLQRPLLDVLRLGAHQLLGMRVPNHAAVSETVALARANLGAGSAQLTNAVLRRVSEKSLAEWLTLLAENAATPVEALSVVESHPVWIVRAFRDALAADGRSPDEVAALLEADNQPPQVSLVIRPLPDAVVEPDSVDEAAATEPGVLVPTAVRLRHGDPARLPAVAAGQVGVQDEGSQAVTLALAAAPLEGKDERWLDLCAGPGGKAALLGALAAQRHARLFGNEVSEHRAELVRQALKAIPPAAIEAVRVGDGRELGELEPSSFDRVLVDAPCSGLGALRRRPEARWRRQPSDIAALRPLQTGLLNSALQAVRVGGVVGYVTCSPHVAETTVVVDDAIRVAAKQGIQVEKLDAAATLRDVVLPEVRDTITTRADLAVQLWPHIHKCDAMYLALLRRVA